MRENQTKKYTIKAPVGTYLAPEGPIDENQLREFALQINNNEEGQDVWIEKIQKDDIESVVEWLEGIGYEIEAVENPS